MIRRRWRSALACVAMGFVVVVAATARRADPQSRLPQQFQLAGLIQRQQGETAVLSRQVGELERQVAGLRAAGTTRAADQASIEAALADAGLRAGTVAVGGPGLRVILDDSSVRRAPAGGNLDDLVIHSQDVQAVVNALWRAGAEAIAINDQRLVGTSAVLCVGNTLLLNGTVHSPPYAVLALGAARERFESDDLVKILHTDASAFGLRFSVSHEDNLALPAFAGATQLRTARVGG